MEVASGPAARQGKASNKRTGVVSTIRVIGWTNLQTGFA